MSMKLGVTPNLDLRTPRDKVVDATMDAALWAAGPVFEGLGSAQRILDAKKAGQEAIAVRRIDRYRFLLRKWVRYLLTNSSEQAGNPPGVDVYYGSARSPIEALKERALAALEEEKPKWNTERKSRLPMPLSFFLDFTFSTTLEQAWHSPAF